jgi:hypothetical protein
MRCYQPLWRNDVITHASSVTYTSRVHATDGQDPEQHSQYNVGLCRNTLWAVAIALLAIIASIATVIAVDRYHIRRGRSLEIAFAAFAGIVLTEVVHQQIDVFVALVVLDDFHYNQQPTNQPTTNNHTHMIERS